MRISTALLLNLTESRAKQKISYEDREGKVTSGPTVENTQIRETKEPDA